MRMDAVFKALSDPTRRQILRLLSAGPKTAGELSEHFEISGPAMSHHFNALKNAELITPRRKGQMIYYSLNTTVFEDLMTVLLDIFQRAEAPQG